MSEQRVKLSPEEQAKKLSEFTQKELEVKAARLEREYQKLVRDRSQAQDLEKLTFDITDGYIQKILDKNNNKFKSADKKMQLIYGLPELSVPIPFYAGEMILMGARTGTGKTTACVNIAYSLIRQGKKPIVITNEESTEDFINRLAALFLEKRYANLEKLDQETRDRINGIVPKLLKLVRVIDADFAKMNGLNIERLTNSIEGLKFIEKKLLQEANQGNVFDAIIIDYYQKFNFSIEYPDMRPYECQEQAAAIIENLRVNYPAPIIMFVQMSDGKDEEDGMDAPFEHRIQGRKIIANYATVILEITVNRKESTTEFKLHKGRNMEYINGKIKVGWDNGKYVKFDKAFIDKVNQRKIEAFKQRAGLSESPDTEEEEEN
jgi:hypothetical protein